MEGNRCTECVGRPLGSSSTLFDFRIGSVSLVVAGGHPIRKDADVNLIAIGCVAGECATYTEYFVVGVRSNTEYGHI